MPNSQLQAILDRFAAQPGVEPQQVALLRSTLSADAELLAGLNTQAANGQLQSLKLEAASDPSLIGRYDKASGEVSLPVASFANSDELRATLGLQSISADFAHRSWQEDNQTHQVSQNMVDNLQATLNGSPVLAGQAKLAVQHKHLQYIGFLPSGMTAGATYDGYESDGTPKGIKIPPALLQSKSEEHPKGGYDAHDMTFVLGHEIQHGFNDAALDLGRQRFLQAITRQAQAPDAIHDYTDELNDFLQTQSQDEARAQIAGWNALLSREQQLKPGADIHHMLHDTKNDRMLDFLDRDPANPDLYAVAKPGINFNADHSLSPTPGNLAALNQHYFERPSKLYAQPGERAMGIGESPAQTSNYPNYHANWAIEQIVTAERHYNAHRPPGSPQPQVAIDMAGLRLKEDLLEMEGLNLGQDKTPFAYLDISQTPPVQRHFNHTQDGSMGHDHQHVPVATPAQSKATQVPLPDTFGKPLPPSDDLRDSHHPGHQFYQRALGAVHRMEAEQGIQSSPQSEVLAARLAAEAAEHKQGITHVQMQGGQIHAIERHYAFDAGKRFSIAAQDAVAVSIEDASRRWLNATSPYHRLSRSQTERSPEQLQALHALEKEDQRLFAAMRERLPASVSDETVAQALIQAKQNGISDVSRLDKVMLHGEHVYVTSTTPGFYAKVNVGEQAPPLQESVNQLQEQNQQHLKQQQQQEQQQQQSRGMSMG